MEKSILKKAMMENGRMEQAIMTREDEIIKIKKNLQVTDLSGEKVMVDYSTSQYFLLKDTASDIWDILKNNVTFHELVQQLMAVYEIDRTSCESSVRRFLAQLAKMDMIEWTV